MEGQNGARPRPAARGKGKAPVPPPPPPSGDEAGGGHRRGQRRRRRRIRVRGEVLALAAMIAAAAYILFADGLAVPPPLAGWFFVAYVVWILGLSLLYAFMN
ncbi:hypothetical protein ACP70R_044022 [Stipagrostis hirtigluma subsp. patula]